MTERKYLLPAVALAHGALRPQPCARLASETGRPGVRRLLRGLRRSASGARHCPDGAPLPAASAADDRARRSPVATATARPAGVLVRDRATPFDSPHAGEYSLFRRRSSARRAIPAPGLVWRGGDPGRQAAPDQPPEEYVQNSAQKFSRDLDHRGASPRPTRLDRRTPLFCGLPASVRVRRIRGRLPYLATVGSAGVRGVDGPASLHSRLAFNMIDLDYSSRQLNLGHSWDMKWTFGFRILSLFFDSRSDQPLAQAAAGSGIYQEREFNNLVGLGPHTALDMARHLGDSGWACGSGPIFRASSTGSTPGFSPGPRRGALPASHLPGNPISSATKARPSSTSRPGVSWQPSRFSSTRFFLGYQYERWFALEGVVDSGSHGQLWDQGVVMQATFHF